jgi:hypothetical protein
MVSRTKVGPFVPTEGAVPTVIRLVVTVLAFTVLAFTVLIVVLSIKTFDATKRMFPLVVANCPDVFVIELVARRLLM